LGVPDKKIALAVSTFKPLEHRLECVGVYRDITFYNDSLATVPEATIHALDALDGKVATLIAGGFDRGLTYEQLGVAVAHSSVKHLILFPDTGAKIKSAVLKADPHTNITMIPVDSMKTAVSEAFRLTSPGKVCILSPASASFNLFKDYKERGDAFKRAVREYGDQ
jgi:UDP-N-acetylmuramoylalanine--D-glutamate ligase